VHTPRRWNLHILVFWKWIDDRSAFSLTLASVERGGEGADALWIRGTGAGLYLPMPMTNKYCIQ